MIEEEIASDEESEFGSAATRRISDTPIRMPTIPFPPVIPLLLLTLSPYTIERNVADGEQKSGPIKQ